MRAISISSRPWATWLVAASLGALFAMQAWGQAMPFADPASIAFEEQRWEDAIREYERILEGNPADRLSWLRIAQAERELGRHEAALESLDRAEAAEAPVAMVDLERARNLLVLGREEDGLTALYDADHNELRALNLLEESSDFDSVRDDPLFQGVLGNVRARVYPCENIEAAYDFDFWVGEWEVRTPAGALAGHDTISKEPGGCALQESWRGTGGSTGTSTSFYLPSRKQWRQVWVGSNATMIDMTGGLVDGEMKMEGTIEYAHQDRVLAFRATWSVAEDGRVRQHMEEFDLVNNGWRLWFDGFYRRVDEP